MHFFSIQLSMKTLLCIILEKSFTAEEEEEKKRGQMLQSSTCLGESVVVNEFWAFPWDVQMFSSLVYHIQRGRWKSLQF